MTTTSFSCTPSPSFEGIGVGDRPPCGYRSHTSLTHPQCLQATTATPPPPGLVPAPRGPATTQLICGGMKQGEWLCCHHNPGGLNRANTLTLPPLRYGVGRSVGSLMAVTGQGLCCTLWHWGGPWASVEGWGGPTPPDPPPVTESGPVTGSQSH